MHYKRDTRAFPRVRVQVDTYPAGVVRQVASAIEQRSPEQLGPLLTRVTKLGIEDSQLQAQVSRWVQLWRCGLSASRQASSRRAVHVPVAYRAFPSSSTSRSLAEQLSAVLTQMIIRRHSRPISAPSPRVANMLTNGPRPASTSVDGRAPGHTRALTASSGPIVSEPDDDGARGVDSDYMRNGLAGMDGTGNEGEASTSHALARQI